MSSKMEIIEDNFIKRERMRKLETQKRIHEMRAALPVYDIKDIRRHKLPFHEALVIELNEDGHEQTVAYLQQLFDLQETMRQEAGPNSFFWNRPVLKKSNEDLKVLSEALVSAEIAHNQGDYVSECEYLLKVGIHFAFETEDWWWLGKQVIIQSVVIATEYQVDEGKYEATSRYVYGKYLMENSREYDAAVTELNIARDLAVGKNWNIRNFLPDHKDTLYMNTNYLLFVCIIKDAKITMKHDYEAAAAKALLAKKHAAAACYHDGETEALLIKGVCELNMSQTKQAIASFNKAYYIQAKQNSAVGMCEARVQLSKAYLVHGNTKLALQNLLMLKEKAEKCDLPYYLAQANRYLGEYYLNSGEPREATPLLEEALRIFIEQGNIAESEQVRNLGAVSAGLELLPAYVELILKTRKTRPDSFENLMKLVRWKDSRAPFTDVSEAASVTRTFSDKLEDGIELVAEAADLPVDEPMEVDVEEDVVVADGVAKIQESQSQSVPILELHKNLSVIESSSSMKEQ